MRSSDEGDAPWKKMADARAACAREIEIGKEIASTAATSLRRTLLSVRSASERALADREKLRNARDYFNKLEADLAERQSVKACRESKQIIAVDSLSTANSRIEKLKEIVADQRSKKDKYTTIINQQLCALESFEKEELNYRGRIVEAAIWYSKVLGFRVEGGEGVKFIFDKIDLKNPDKEFSFTIKLNGDKYLLLQCQPRIENAEILLKDLNESNSLFKFVRIMREQFFALVSNVTSTCTASISGNLDSSSILISSPPPVSIDSSREMRPTDSQLLQTDEYGQSVPRKLPRQRRNNVNPSPASVSALRRSPRF